MIMASIIGIGELEPSAEVSKSPKDKEDIEDNSNCEGAEGDGDRMNDEDDGDSDEDDYDVFSPVEVFDSGDDSESNENIKNTYRVLSPDDVLQTMTEFIDDTAAKLGLPVTRTKTLLQFFGWAKEKLLEAYFTSADQKLFLVEHGGTGTTLGIEIDRTKSCPTPLIPTETSAVVPVDTKLCDLCHAKLHSFVIQGMNCGHRFCAKCWNDYWFKIGKNVGETVVCAHPNCSDLVDDATVMKFLTDSEAKLRFQRHTTNNYVQSNRLMCWCPSKDCPNAIMVVMEDRRQPVICSCGFKFCFSCEHAWHDSLECSLLTKWLKKEDEFLSLNWIYSCLKNCPNCDGIVEMVEENATFDHTTCSYCGLPFCWNCVVPGGVVSPYHVLGKCDSNYGTYLVANNADTTQGKWRESIQRYLEYRDGYKRYEMELLTSGQKNYEYLNSDSLRSMSVDMETGEEVKEQRNTGLARDVQLLKKAAHVLFECRETLMWTHVLAYYLLDTHYQTELFKWNQKPLEEAAQKLAELVDINITDNIPTGIKVQIRNALEYCEQRRQCFVNLVHEGYEKKLWAFNEDC